MKIVTWKIVVPLLLAFELCLFLLTRYYVAIYLIFCGASLGIGLLYYLGKKKDLKDLGQALILTAICLPVLAVATAVLFMVIVVPFKS